MSLKLTSRINLRGQGARRTLDFGQSPPPPPRPSHSLEGVIPGQKEPIVPTGTINNPFRTAKAATNDNHRRNQK